MENNSYPLLNALGGISIDQARQKIKSELTKLVLS
jgi:hypothetical protein